MERIDRMLRDLLDASRVDAGGTLTVSVAPCDLRDVACAVLDELGTVHGARFRLHVRAAPVGHWDCDALRRLFENLANNAIRYGTPEGPVTITLDASSADAIIEVHNEGDPIPDDVQAAIFQPHLRQQAHEEGRRRGWGLGLAVVRGIVDAHGGSIELRSTAGEGTAFRVRLPLTPAGDRDG